MREKERQRETDMQITQFIKYNKSYYDLDLILFKIVIRII